MAAVVDHLALQVITKAAKVCETKNEVRSLASRQCACLVAKVDKLHKYLVSLLEFKREFLLECRPILLQIDRLLDRARCLLQRCSSSDWLWQAVLKHEHKLKFQIVLQELSQSVFFLRLKVASCKNTDPPAGPPQRWEWPAADRDEHEEAARVDRESLKLIAAALPPDKDPHAVELGKYLLAEWKNGSCRHEELPQFLFRNPDKVIQGKLIGEGSYASVYEAAWLGRTIATKAYAVHDPSCERELLTLFSLRHPHIVKMVGYTQRSRGGPFVLLMERMERDLHNLIRDRIQGCDSPPFEMEVAIDIILQIARGMEFLHANDTSHRDLKTANILINLPNKDCNFYTAKLSDFGLAETKLKSAQTKIPLRRAGTVNFMAPEVWNEESNASRKKADVYSFGMTCYEILTGKLPFEGCSHSAAGFFLRVRDNNLRPSLPDDFPKSLSLFLQCCWHGRPEIRPTFSKICNYLVALKHAVSVGVDPPQALPDKQFLSSPIGDILDEEKQVAAIGTRDHHEAILAALESLQKEAQDKLACRRGGAEYRKTLELYVRDSQRLMVSVAEHRNKFVNLQRRAAQMEEEEEAEASERKGSSCSCFGCMQM